MIAVLPFADLSPEGDNEYFADGMAEEILNALVKVRGLRVAARTSSFAFKGKNADVRAVGEELGVQTVLEGSVRKEGDLLRITAQLINVADGFHLWSETYNRKLESVFAIQEEIATAIVTALSVPLGLAGSEQLVSSRTGDVRGYELYLQGRFLFGQRGDVLRRAISLFQEALARDSLFAPAYAGLAEAYALLPYYRLGEWEESLSRAEAAARRALAVDSTLAEAHVALANVHRDRWQRDQAEQHYRRALTLSPENAEAHHQYAQYLTFVGKLDAGVEASARALELDPLSPIVNTIHGWNLYFVRRYDDAIRQLERAVELDPAFPLAGRRLVWAYLLSSRYVDAEREARRIAELQRWSPDAYATLVRAPADPGQRPEALRILESLEGEEGVIDAHSKIAWYVVLGAHARALELVELHWRPPGIIGNSLLDPALDPLRDDPRFQAVQRRVHGPG